MSEENVARIKQGLARMDRENLPDLELLDPEVELINFDTFPVTRPYRGREGAMEWFADISEPFQEFRVELVDVLAHDDTKVVTTARAVGSSKAGGPPFELVWGIVWTFRDGLATRVEGLRTAEEALDAAGLSP